jgi:hypothetical protein
MHARAQNNDPNKFLASHGFLAEWVKVIGGGSAPGGPNGNPEVALEATGKFASALSKWVLTYRNGKESALPNWMTNRETGPPINLLSEIKTSDLSRPFNLAHLVSCLRNYKPIGIFRQESRVL